MHKSAIALTLAVIFFIATLAALSTSQAVFAQSMQDLIDNMDRAIARVTEAQASTTESGNIIVLSHRFETDGLPKIIGEVQNNGSRSYDKFDLDIVVNFRDAVGTLIVSENGFIDAETLAPGDSSAFEAISFDKSLPDTASTYDVIVDDNRVVVGASLEGDSGSEGNDDDDDNEDDEDD